MCDFLKPIIRPQSGGISQSKDFSKQQVTTNEQHVDYAYASNFAVIDHFFIFKNVYGRRVNYLVSKAISYDH